MTNSLKVLTSNLIWDLNCWILLNCKVHLRVELVLNTILQIIVLFKTPSLNKLKALDSRILHLSILIQIGYLKTRIEKEDQIDQFQTQIRLFTQWVLIIKIFKIWMRDTTKKVILVNQVKTPIQTQIYNHNKILKILQSKQICKIKWSKIIHRDNSLVY